MVPVDPDVSIRMYRRIRMDLILFAFETRRFILFLEKSYESICEVLKGGLNSGAIHFLELGKFLF
ncbi:hypothetical protein BBR47_08210 [Brevibacillus brevis NBRC 100599]|uniref:Uncharacterized protein n=1 Tax=Brevibacillus brevis (strain 47 / JCM 6285 / NBRC 100599) TaxID=358681 RepID=C0Z4S1_BREBN|nr:hypothetical protein BBR47_08210 [Brevibacillus brevis NBRC 100599]